MKNFRANRFIRKSRFTLFELLISVGLLVVLSVVLLRTLVLTADYWRKTDEHHQLQADAKTFFTLLSDDLGNLVYSQDNGGFYAPLYLENTRLGMITHNRLQSKNGSSEAYSDICKVIYRFVDSNGTTPGRIERLCSSDAVVNGNTLGNYDMSSTSSGTFYPASLNNNSVVIDTVVNFQIAAYRFEKDGSEDKPVKVDNSDVFSSGSVRMLHVKLVLLPAKLFGQYNAVSGTSGKNDFVNKHGRIYYKTFWVKPTNQ